MGKAVSRTTVSLWTQYKQSWIRKDYRKHTKVSRSGCIFYEWYSSGNTVLNNHLNIQLYIAVKYREHVLNLPMLLL